MDGEDLAISMLASRQAKQSQQLKDIQKWQEYQAAGTSRETIIRIESAEAQRRYEIELNYQFIAKWLTIPSAIVGLYNAYRCNGYYADAWNWFSFLLAAAVFLVCGYYALVPASVEKSYCWQLAEKMPDMPAAAGAPPVNFYEGKSARSNRR